MHGDVAICGQTRNLEKKVAESGSFPASCREKRQLQAEHALEKKVYPEAQDVNLSQISRFRMFAATMRLG